MIPIPSTDPEIKARNSGATYYATIIKEGIRQGADVYAVSYSSVAA